MSKYSYEDDSEAQRVLRYAAEDYNKAVRVACERGLAVETEVSNGALINPKTTRRIVG